MIDTIRSGSAQPNVLLIMCDQLQWHAIAGRTICRMPNVQRIVDRGMLFNRAYTPSAICCPARAMLCSGAYHWHNGVYNQVHVHPAITQDMRPDVVTYSQRLKEAGYWLGYTGKWHASHVRTPLDFGFDEIAGPSGYTPAMLQGIAFRPGDGPEHNPNRTPHRIVHQRVFQWPETKPFAQWETRVGDERLTESCWFADAGIRMLQRAARSGKPWHVEVQFQAPHDPYWPFQQYVDHYRAADIPVPASFRDAFENKPHWHHREASLWEGLTEQDVQESRAHYYAYCEQLDTQIGRVLDALEATGQKDRTMIIFTTDHGDLVGAHRMYGKGWMPYEECYRIPLVIAWPGHIREGSTCNHLVQLHDVAHTLADIAAASPLPFADGRSLAPLFARPDHPDWEDALLCAYYGGEYLLIQRMLITRRYKYVHNGFDIDMMFDLQNDPDEIHNLVLDPACAAVRDALRHQLLDLMIRHGDPYSSGAKYSIRRFLFGSRG
jgi:arylsulfatase A-like enzyme